MALTDSTIGGRIIKEFWGKTSLVLTGTVKVGDLVAASGVQADGNNNLPAKFIAGQGGVSGDTITVYRGAVISGVTGGTAGYPVYLSDTAGGYSETASTTSRQVVGYQITAAEMLIQPDWFETHSYINTSFAAADVAGTTAAKVFFIATRRLRITKVSESHAVVAGQAGTLDIEKLTGVQAPGGGNGAAVLGASKIDLTGTINTVVSPALTSTAADLVLEVGDRLALKLASGAATSLANAQVTIEVERA